MPQPSRAPASFTTSASPATILVVDDSPVNLQVLVRILDGSGHRILAARSGKSALEIAERARPDLMLLDVMMPDMDGFAVCRAIKSRPVTRDIAVIFLSALGEVEDKVAGLGLGAADYITKPVQAEEVLARVSNHLAMQRLERELRRSRDLLDQELASAAEMQRLLLPHPLPEIPGMQIAAHYSTSRHVGGDYYDILPLPDSRCGVFIADVSGHGAPSAIIMAMIRALLHAYPAPPVDPAAVLKYINRHFKFLWGSSILATVLYAVIDPGRPSITMATAGHPPPLLFRGDAARPLACDGSIPLLLMDTPAIPTFEDDLARGDRLLFFTDGITERHNSNGEMYEMERLCEAFRASSNWPVAGALEQIVADVEVFAAGRESGDDQTLVLAALPEHL